MGSLTYNDKKAMVAAALGVSEYRIDDLSDAEVFYTAEAGDSPSSSLRGSFKRTYSIGEGNKITLGEPVRGIVRRIWEPITIVAAFALDITQATFSETDDMVILEGKVFEAGDYPDKGFSMTEEELDQAVSEFKPVDNDLEHESTILDGKLGRLESVVRRGKELVGKVSIPKALHQIIGQNAIKVSLAWLKESKRIVGNALVLDPRISDAQVVAAFSAYAEATAERNPANQPNGGAEVPEKRTWWAKLLNLHKEKQLPEGMEDFDPQEVRFAEESPPEPKPPTQQPENQDQARFTALETENAGLRAAGVQTSAERFYGEMLAAGKCLPAEKDSLIAMFKQAALDDNQGKACFSASGELQTGERVKTLRALIEGRPTLNLTSEQLGALKPEDLVILTGGGGQGDADTPTATGKPISEARKQSLRKAAGIAEGGK